MSTQKTILVTGGAGFIGSHLCERLVKDGHRVISLDNYFTGSKDNHVSGVEYIEGHTKDIARLVSVSPDLIFHLGEYSRVAKSIEEPDIVWDLNLAGTTGMLEFWRAHPCKLVYAGSSTKFADTRTDGIEGRDLSPYTWAKAANTDLVANYASWYGLPYAITYFYNVYGPRELSGAYGTAVEIFHQQYLRGEPLTVNAPGTQTRHYTHVLDTVSGLVLVGEKGEGDGFGIGTEKSFATLALAQLFGREILMRPARKTSRPSSPVDSSKLRALGWKEEHSLEEYVASLLQK
jgi:UDP-glucose 4-epimerase